MKPNETDLRRMYETERLTTRAIAARVGSNKTDVRRWLRACGVTLRDAHNGLLNRGVEPPTRDDLERWVHVERLTYSEIAAKFGADFTAVPYWLKKHGIATQGVRNKRKDNPGAETLRGLYEAGESSKAIGKRFGVAPSTAAGWMVASGIEMRPPGFRWKDFPAPDAETLREMYGSGMSLEEVGKALGYTASYVGHLCKSHGIDRRAAGFDGGRRYTCDNGEIVLSVYEQRVCNWLHAHSLAYVYEPKLPFGKPNGGGRDWRADFLVNGWYIEVWGVHGKGWAKYQERKLRKVQLYAAHRLPLIQLTFKNCLAEAPAMDRKLRRCMSPAPTPLALTFDPAS